MIVVHHQNWKGVKFFKNLYSKKKKIDVSKDEVSDICNRYWVSHPQQI